MYKLVCGILVMVLCRSSPIFAQREIQEVEDARRVLPPGGKDMLPLQVEHSALG